MADIHILVADDSAGQRLDAFLGTNDGCPTRSACAHLIEGGAVAVNGETCLSKKYAVRAGDRISVDLPEPHDPTDVIPEAIPLDIRYEDDYLIVLSKQRGLVCHPAHGHESGTLANALVYHCGIDHLGTVQGEDRPGIVHRIDRDTSGLIIAAKNDYAHQFLSAQLADHTLARTYECIVVGNLREDSGTVDAPIARDSRDRKRMAVVPGGRRAVTHWEVIARYPGYTHVRCRLETGRTHQIRVHMSWQGHPLFNDERYGGDRILKGTTFSKYRQFVENCFTVLPRHALHARSLGFVHPTTRETVYFESELPADFRALLGKWETYAAASKETDNG